MKRIKIALATLGLIVGIVSQASAVPIISESYLGTDIDGDKWLMSPGYSATFNFDLTQTGGLATLKDAANATLFIVSPTLDATSYDPLTMAIASAKLSFMFSDSDANDEPVKYDVSIQAKNYTLGSQTFTLGGDFQASTAFVEFNLNPFVSLLQDGTLISLLVTPVQPGYTNNINLDKTTYTVETVPEPSTLLLLGAGLIAAPFIRRRMKK